MEDKDPRPVLFGWWGVLLVWMAWGAINILHLGAMPEHSWLQAFRYGFPDIFIWAAFTPLIVAVSRRFEVRGPRRWRNIALHSCVAPMVIVGHAAVDASLAGLFSTTDAAAQLWKLVFTKVLIYESHTQLLIYMLVAGFVHYQAYSRRLAEQQAEASRLAAQLTEARLTSLRSQLRPHFLFNALNSVAALMGESPEQGRRVVRRLGELLRASLRSGDEHFISLAEELDLVRAYLEIEQARFEDRLEVHIDAPPDVLACQVPALLLQPIVENAVSHGIAPRVDGGSIEVRAHRHGPRLVLEVEDDGEGLKDPRLSRSSEGTGIGLTNTRNRLQTLFGEDALLRLDDGPRGGARVHIEVPSRRQEAA